MACDDANGNRQQFLLSASFAACFSFLHRARRNLLIRVFGGFVGTIQNAELFR